MDPMFRRGLPVLMGAVLLFAAVVWIGPSWPLTLLTITAAGVVGLGTLASIVWWLLRD